MTTVGLDATPLLGARTGVARYVERLLAALATDGSGLDLVGTAFTLRGAGGLAGALPPGVAARHRPVPARALQALWGRAGVPPVEWLTGPLDLFHATNFVLPPLRKARGVVTVHDLTFLRHPSTVSAASLRYRRLVPRSVRRAAVVCTPSAAVAEEVRAEYGDGTPVVVTPLGVDPAWFSAEPPSPAWLAAHDLPERYLLFVGTREPRKNLPVLLAAYAGLPDPPPLVLAGPPGWGPALDTSGVRTPGYLPDADLRAVVAGAAALVLPSAYEGFGLPALEAFATGTPVVASDLPVLREVTGTLATLVPPGDTDALAGGLAAVLAADSGPEAREQRKSHAAAWTWDRCAEATRAAYALALR